MPSRFDAYHLWLGIPAEEQPPNHYRLLGVEPFQADTEVIATAAYRQMRRLREFQSGPHASTAQELISEVAVAKACLVRRDTKAEYDRQLHEKLAVGAASQSDPPVVESEISVDATSDHHAVAAAVPPAVKTVASQPKKSAPADRRRIGEYELLEELGQGGMGTVYRAHHTKLGRHVALKVLHKERVADAKAISRFEREMRAVGGLDHANIVRAEHAGEAEGTWFLVMELLDGLDLAEIVRHQGPLGVADACEVVRQAALGLQHAHERDLVHRDIKPSNLMITPAGQVKILDMGLARLNEDQSSEETDLTTAGQIMGTIDYMAPEQSGESHEVDIRADIYSLGASLYKLLSGQAPFSGDHYNTHIKKLVALATEEPPPIQELRTDVPLELASVLHCMLAKSPDRRFATPADVADAVGPFTADADLGNLLARARNQPPVERPSRAMEATLGSATSGLTRFFQRVNRNVPPSAAPAAVGAADTAAEGTRSPWKLVLLVGGPALAVLLLGVAAILAWLLPSKPAPPPSRPVLVFDWPVGERRDVRLLIDDSAVHFPDAGPLEYTCQPGPHEILARRRGFKPFTATVEVKGGERLAVSPVWLPQTYLVLELPADVRPSVRVEIDGSPPDYPPGEVESNAEWIKLPIAAGLHEVRIVRRGFEPVERQLTVTEGQVATVAPEWKESTGATAVASADDPEGITIPPGETPPDSQFPSPQKLPVPAEADREALAASIDEAFQVSDATTAATQAEVARQLLDASRSELDLTKQYVLLSRAVDLAVEAGESTLAASAIDAIAERFDVDAAEWKQSALAKIEQRRQAEMATRQAREEAARATAAARQRRASLVAALQPAEDRVAAWDFTGATSALEPVTVHEDPDFAARATQRRDELRRMAGLKSRMITSINAARGRLQKSDLSLKGINGEIVGADEQGIHTRLVNGRDELLPWGELNDKARSELLRLAVDPSAADDWLAAGLLALVSQDTPLAERLLAKARDLGTDIRPYLGPLAETVFARAIESLTQQEFEEATAALAELEKKYGKTPWFDSNRELVLATRTDIKQRQYEAAAEDQYLQAKTLFEKKQLFDLKEVITGLKADYPDSAAVTQSDRSPSFAEMEQAVADLGRRLVVRLDGKGDYKSIQAAIDAAKPNSVIEIQDNGPYNEKVNVSQEGITLRGKEGFWPIITSKGPVTNFPVLVNVSQRGISMERLVLVHTGAAGNSPACLVNSAGSPPPRVRSCVLVGNVSRGSYDFDTSVLLGAFATGTSYVIRDCQWLSGAVNMDCKVIGTNSVVRVSAHGAKHGDKLRSCVIANGNYKVAGPGTVLVDCVISAVESNVPDTRFEHCNVHGKTPFIDRAKPGKGCFGGNPQFVNPKLFDYRLLPGSPCRGKASDGGDVGVRYTPEMVEVLGVALELRARGVIKF